MAKKRYDVAVDPASIDVERGRLLHSPVPDDNETRLGLLEVFAAKVRDRHRRSICGTPIGRVVAPRDIGQQGACLLAGLIGGQNAIAPECEAAAAPVLVPVLKDEGDGPTRLHPDAEAGKF